MKDNDLNPSDNPSGKSKMRPSRKEESIPVYKETIKDVNAKILKITTVIREEYPELEKELAEMPETLPDEKHPNTEKNLQALKDYYESLTAMLNKYKLERHFKSK